MNQVQIDVEQGRFMLLFADHVRFPDFLEQGLCGHCVFNSWRAGFASGSVTFFKSATERR
jgi:hypothetical protein